MPQNFARSAKLCATKQCRFLVARSRKFKLTPLRRVSQEFFRDSSQEMRKARGYAIRFANLQEGSAMRTQRSFFVTNVYLHFSCDKGRAADL